MYKKINNNLFYENSDETIIQIAFAGGHSLNKGTSGLAHLVEHSIFLNEHMNSLKDDFYDVTATISNEFTNFELIVSENEDESVEDFKNRLTNGLKNFVDILFSENFTINDLEFEKKVIEKEAINGFKDSLTNSFYLFQWEIETNNLNGNKINYIDTIGTFESLKDLSIQDIHDFKRINFTKENVFVFVKTPLNSVDALEVVENGLINLLPSNLSTKFNIPKMALINQDNYYLYKHTNNANNTYISIIITFNNACCTTEEACLCADLINFYSSSLEASTYLTKINAFFRKEGLVYDVDYFAPFSLGDNLGYYISFETSRDDIRKSILATSRYFRKVFLEIKEKDFFDAYLEYLNEPCYFEEGETNIEGLIALSEVRADKIKNLTQLNQMVKRLVNANEFDVVNIIEKMIDNFNINLIVAGNVEYVDLPDLLFLKDVMKNEFKGIKDYSSSMQTSPNWKDVKKLKSVTGEESFTRAISLEVEKNSKK